MILKIKQMTLLTLKLMMTQDLMMFLSIRAFDSGQQEQTTTTWIWHWPVHNLWGRGDSWQLLIDRQGKQQWIRNNFILNSITLCMLMLNMVSQINHSILFEDNRESIICISLFNSTQWTCQPEAKVVESQWMPHWLLPQVQELRDSKLLESSNHPWRHHK